MAWQTASGYNRRTLVEADISRLKRVVGDGLCFPTDLRRATEVATAVNPANPAPTQENRGCGAATARFQRFSLSLEVSVR